MLLTSSHTWVLNDISYINTGQQDGVFAVQSAELVAVTRL
jgi:hypothetical protein